MTASALTDFLVVLPNWLEAYLLIGVFLFCCGAVTVVVRRNIIAILIGVELMLNASALNFVAFGRFGPEGMAVDGQVIALFVVILAAAEAAVGLAIALNIFKRFRTVDASKPDLAKN